MVNALRSDQAKETHNVYDMERPIDRFLPLRQAMDRLVEGSFLWPERFVFFSGQTFPIDVYEAKDQQQYVVEATVPGFSPEEIQVTAEGSALRIHAAKKQEQQEEKGGYMRRERYEGAMTRVVPLPSPIDESQVEATYEQGMLTVRVPKAEGATAKQIPIKVQQAAGARSVLERRSNHE